jgi:pyrroloquinoline quinone biosynthesis protein B
LAAPRLVARRLNPALEASMARLAALLVALLGLAVWAAGAAGRGTALEASTPRLVVLGTAQDGGMPQAACSCERCTRARRQPEEARFVASLALVLPEIGKVFLFDATPDLPRQLELLRPYRRFAAERLERRPLDGLFLTHAHMGHYLGLAHLGFESIHAEGVPLWGSQRMVDFLGKNGPWDQLVKLGNVVPKVLAAGQRVELGQGVSVEAFPVPHRDEYTDTLAFLVRGPRRTALYVPDTDAWKSWAPSLEERLEGVSVALLDATFYSMDELPWRDISQVRHPLVVDTMDRLQERVESGKLEVRFLHLNHTNPALDEGSAARRTIEQRGFGLAREGQEIGL